MNRRLWLAVAAIALYGRALQTGTLWAEEGLPLAVAQQMLGGGTLYRDIWFDKPPLLAWFYVAVLKLGGYSGYVLRAVGFVYVVAVALAGYGLARRLYGETAGRWAAFFLAFFLTFYVPSATTPLAADLLLVLPQLGTFWLLAAGRPLWAGLVAGVAFHLNTKAIFIVLAGALAFGQIPRLLAGFWLGALAGLPACGLFDGYWEQVWRWGAAYAGAAFTENPWALGAQRTLAWLGFHAALVVGMAARRDRKTLLWAVVSLAAVVLGARFFPRYYFQLLPALAVAGAAGWVELTRRRWTWALLAAMLAVPAVRFAWTRARDTAIDRDSRQAAALAADLTRPDQRIFVWGFRPEIYYYARRLGASRYLESQPLTGVPADRHLERSDAFHPESVQGHRLVLEAELRAHPPAVVVDGLGPYNPRLAIPASLVAGYRPAGETAGTRIWVR
jgi:4-amino-4-deoxy-L-arabinose transferase-like glycosyltransferase